MSNRGFRSHCLITLLFATLIPAAAQAQFETILTASGGNPHSLFFGQRVALSGDYAVIGEPLRILGTRRAGAAYIFERVDGAWRQATKLTAPDPTANDKFGDAVAIDAE